MSDYLVWLSFDCHRMGEEMAVLAADLPLSLGGRHLVPAVLLWQLLPWLTLVPTGLELLWPSWLDPADDCGVLASLWADLPSSSSAVVLPHFSPLSLACCVDWPPRFRQVLLLHQSAGGLFSRDLSVLGLSCLYLFFHIPFDLHPFCLDLFSLIPFDLDPFCLVPFDLDPSCLVPFCLIPFDLDPVSVDCTLLGRWCWLG